MITETLVERHIGAGALVSLFAILRDHYRKVHALQIIALCAQLMANSAPVQRPVWPQR
jgi:hypothetical protein